MRVDAEIDFHGLTRQEMLNWLEDNWSRRRWHGLRRVRVIHGKGEVLPGALRDWCSNKGIPWAPESGNPGSAILHPSSRHNQSFQPSKKPLAAIKKRETPSPPPDRELSTTKADSQLFEQAVADLSDTEPQTLRRRKHN